MSLDLSVSYSGIWAFCLRATINLPQRPPLPRQKRNGSETLVIGHFQIDRNTLFCPCIVFNFSWDLSQIENKSFAKFWRDKKSIVVNLKMDYTEFNHT